MLTEIENYLFDGNYAHDLYGLEKQGGQWKLVLVPIADRNIRKTFIFEDVEEEYEQLLLDEGESLEFPLPVIGFESFAKQNDIWKFVLNASDVEWSFVSKWPKRS